MKLVLLAGTLTFVNEWVQTQSINWKIPVATVLAGAAVAGVGKVSPVGGGALGVMALIVAATTQLNGKSPIQAFSGLMKTPATTATSSTAKTTATTVKK